MLSKVNTLSGHVALKLWPCPLSAVCTVVGGLFERAGSLLLDFTFKFDWSFACFLCFSAQYICLHASFHRVGELSGLNVDAWRLNIISSLPPNWSWLMYILPLKRGSATGFSHANSSKHPQDATGPGSWESPRNLITVHRQTGCSEGSSLGENIDTEK